MHREGQTRVTSCLVRVLSKNLKRIFFEGILAPPLTLSKTLEIFPGYIVEKSQAYVAVSDTVVILFCKTRERRTLSTNNSSHHKLVVCVWRLRLIVTNLTKGHRSGVSSPCWWARLLGSAACSDKPITLGAIKTRWDL